MSHDENKYNPDIIDKPIQIIKQPTITFDGPNIIEINDIRSSSDFRGISFSNYKRSDVKKKLIDAMKSKNIEFHFLVGNHDYWVGDFIREEIMDKVYLEDTEITINNKKIFVTHGDGLLSWDHGYRLLKKVIRSKSFTRLFQWLHPTISYKIAGFISKSGYHNTHKEDFNEKVRTELQEAANKHFNNGFDYMITGHYHLGELFQLRKGKLAVLGDWFFRPSYAVFDGDDLILKHWETNE